VISFLLRESFAQTSVLSWGYEALKESVAGGLGLGLVSRHAHHGLSKKHGVCAVDVEGFPLPSTWHIVHPDRKNLSHLAFTFKQYVLKKSSAEN
jgi:DNA-binding transcriptional LysR family regulator